MNSILSIIRPIELCVGHNPKTAQTGNGCVMDICSYLNGDEQITDETRAVNAHIRPIAMMVNDFETIEGRTKLLKFVPRLMDTEQVDLSNLISITSSFQNFLEDKIREVREAIGLDYGAFEYATYLREKLGFNQRPDFMYYLGTEIRHTGAQYGRAMLYLQRASRDAYEFGHVTVRQAISAAEDALRQAAFQTLEAMLPKSEIVATATHLGRAQQLVDTKLAVWPV